MSIRVLLAEEHLILREGLLALLRKEPSLEVVAETGSGCDTLHLVEQLGPDVVLLDVDIPEIPAVDLTRAICATHPTTKVVVISLHSQVRFVQETLEAGAAGYFGNDSGSAELGSAIRAVMAGQQYLSPAATKVVVSRYLGHTSSVASGAFMNLSACQRQVLQLMASGKSTKQIAAALHRSIKTVETHRQQLMQRLNIHSVAELTKYAVREGLADLET